MSSDDFKDVEEVFEEAVNTPEHLQQDQETKIESGDGGLVGDLGLAVVDEGSNVGCEVERFEEAIGFPSDDENMAAEDKVEDLSGAESGDGVVVPDKVVEGGTERGGTNGELKEGTEASGVGARAESDVLKDGIEEPENGIPIM